VKRQQWTWKRKSLNENTRSSGIHISLNLDGKENSPLTVSKSYLETPLDRRPGRPPTLLTPDRSYVDEFRFQYELINTKDSLGNLHILTSVPSFHLYKRV